MSRIRIFSERRINGINPERKKKGIWRKIYAFGISSYVAIYFHRPCPSLGILTYFLGLHSELVNLPQIEVLRFHHLQSTKQYLCLKYMNLCARLKVMRNEPAIASTAVVLDVLESLGSVRDHTPDNCADKKQHGH